MPRAHSRSRFELSLCRWNPSPCYSLSEAAWSSTLTGFEDLTRGKWLSCACLPASRGLRGRCGGGKGVVEQLAGILKPQLLAFRNELLPWPGRLRCCYPCRVFVTSPKKKEAAVLLIVSRGVPSAQYSQPFLSHVLILPLFQP